MLHQCVANPEECSCVCHRHGTRHVKHFMACCRYCEKCGKNIRTFLFEQHKQDCKGIFNNFS